MNMKCAIETDFSIILLRSDFKRDQNSIFPEEKGAQIHRFHYQLKTNWAKIRGMFFTHATQGTHF